MNGDLEEDNLTDNIIFFSFFFFSLYLSFNLIYHSVYLGIIFINKRGGEKEGIFPL